MTRTLLTAAAAALLLAGPALADDDDDRPGNGKGRGPISGISEQVAERAEDLGALVGVLNGQINLAPSIAALNVSVSEAGDGVSATSAAIGNSLSAEITGAKGVELPALQGNLGDATATLNGSIEGATGTVSLTAAAIGNSASYDVSDLGEASLGAVRQANLGAASAKASELTVKGAQGAVSATAAAIGNSLSVVAAATR